MRAIMAATAATTGDGQPFAGRNGVNDLDGPSGVRRAAFAMLVGAAALHSTTMPAHWSVPFGW